ncbi:hypothetical protein Aduo_013999 [Ancylostoma duodenale]
MSEYGVVKSMLTSAIDDLIRATSRIDQSYFQPFSSQAQLLDKYRSLCERNVDMTCAKFTVESALNILKNRYEEAQRFVGEQHGGETIVQDLNTYWEETKGADLLRSAHSIIFQLQSQIELELPLANQIRDKLGAIVASSEPSHSITRQDSPSLSRNRLSVDDTSTDSEHKAIIDCFRSMKDASSSMLFSASTHQSILMIVQAYARNPRTGSLDPVSILLDSGAQTSFITNSTVSRLSLRPFGFRPLTTVAFGGHRVTEETGLVDVQLLDNTDKPFEVRLYTRNVVAAPRKAQQLHPEDFAALRSNGVDPESLLITQAVQPDILLGMNYFWEVISHGPPVVLPSGLVLSYTRFGPTVSGLSLFVNVAQVVDYSSAERSVDSVSRLWDLDLLGITDDPDPSVDKDEDARILRRFQNTAEEIGGHLYVQFPWKSSHPRLADNKLLAYKRLESQYRSLVSKPQLWKDYAAVFDDYLRLGIIEEVEEFKFEDHRVLPPDVSPEAENEFQTLHAIQVCSYQSPLRFKATNRYLKLVRSTVYVLKFVSVLFRKIRHRPTSLRLSLSLPTKLINAVEFMFAEALVITEHYRESVHQLEELPLARFNAHRSADGLIRCPNRLEHAETSPISAAPILLVPGHPLTTTVVMHYHLENFHSGVHATIASLRTRFFIPSVRSTVAKILRGCIVCKKANCLPYRYPDMPSLPPERVNRFRPFQKVGLDYLGPLYYRDTFHTRGKVWICLFTCMATRAFHLEVVFNNSTQEFILAFRRFIARRGTPDYILSDNATTFCSANDTLQEVIYARSSVEKLSDFFANRKITWKFITPLSPWKGGFYERLVGLFKSAFRKAVHRSLLPLQESQTLVFEVEAVLNARPLTSIRDTSTAPQVLKPIDFISPEVELQIPPSERSSESFPSHRLTDWYRGTISALNQFWNIWYRDYLSLLADRHQKHIRQGRSSPVIPKVSDVVLVSEKNVPRGQWPLGVITALQCNRQKVPRSATVRMPNGRELVRSLNQLYPLEITAEEDQAEPKESGNVIPTRIQPPRAVKRVRSYSR